MIRFRTLRQKISETSAATSEHREANGLNHSSRGQRPRSSIETILRPVRANQIMSPSVQHMPQSLHILSAHIILSTKERQPSLIANYSRTEYGRINHASFKTWNVIQSQSAVWRITFTFSANLTKKFSDSEGRWKFSRRIRPKLMKTLGVPDFHWQDGYGLFSVSPSHFEAVRKYILDQEEHHKRETFQQMNICGF